MRSQRISKVIGSLLPGASVVGGGLAVGLSAQAAPYCSTITLTLAAPGGKLTSPASIGCGQVESSTTTTLTNMIYDSYDCLPNALAVRKSASSGAFTTRYITVTPIRCDNSISADHFANATATAPSTVGGGTGIIHFTTCAGTGS
jgi:hypothetical protein